MPPFLIALFGNIWFRRAALAVAIVVAALIVRQHFIDEGKKQGRADQVSDDKMALKQTLEEDRARTQKVLADAQAQIDDSRRRAEEAEQRVAASTALLVAIAQQRQAGAQTVNQLADSQLHDYIAQQLGRPPADHTPGYTAAEERQLAACVTQYPLCEKENGELKNSVKGLTDQKTENERTITLEEKRYQDLDGYTQRLEQNYATLWNLTPPRYRSAKCLFLWKCGKRKMSVPPPAKREAPHG